MLTLFAIPKPFQGHIGVIQRNAVWTWTRPGTSMDVRVVLMGDESGVRETAESMGAGWHGQLACTPYGTPLLSDAFAWVAQHATTPWVGYINSDILLLPGFFMAVAEAMATGPALLVGRRTTIEQSAPIAGNGPDWADQLRDQVAAKGDPDKPNCIDYFIFPRQSVLAQLPPFAVGRPGWDNWMLFRAWSQGMRVIDLTPRVTVVHQRHDYGHVPQRRGSRWEGPEADENFRLAGSGYRFFSLLDATHEFTPTGVEPIRRSVPLARRLRKCMARYPRWVWPLRVVGAPVLVIDQWQTGGWSQCRRVLADLLGQRKSEQ